MTDPCCHFHPDKPANHCCRNCLNMVCEECLRVGGDTKFYCQSCLKPRHRKRRIAYVVVAMFLLVAFGLGMFVVKKYKYQVFHYKYASAFNLFHSSYLDEPCNTDVVKRFVRFLYEMGEKQDVALVLEEFVAKCDDSPELQYLQAGIYTMLNEYDKAMALLLKLLEKHPENTNYKAGVARVLVNMGKFREALDEYKKMLKKQPDLPQVIFEMVEVNEKMGRYCDNILLLEQYRFYFSTPRDLDSTKEKLAALYAKSECSDVKATVQAYLKSLPPKKAEVANVTKEVKRSHQTLPVFKTYEDTTPPSKQDENKDEKKIRPNERVPGLSFGF